MDVVPAAPRGVTSDGVGDATGERVPDAWASDVCGAGRRWCISTTAADTGAWGLPTGERDCGRGLGPTGSGRTSGFGLSLPSGGASAGATPSGRDVRGWSGNWPGSAARGDRGCTAAGPPSRSRARGAGLLSERGRGSSSGDGDGDGDEEAVECGDADLANPDRPGRASTWLEGSGRDRGASGAGSASVVASDGSGVGAGAPRPDVRG